MISDRNIAPCRRGSITFGSFPSKQQSIGAVARKHGQPIFWVSISFGQGNQSWSLPQLRRHPKTLQAQSIWLMTPPATLRQFRPRYVDGVFTSVKSLTNGSILRHSHLQCTLTWMTNKVGRHGLLLRPTRMSPRNSTRAWKEISSQMSNRASYP